MESLTTTICTLFHSREKRGWNKGSLILFLQRLAKIHASALGSSWIKWESKLIKLAALVWKELCKVLLNFKKGIKKIPTWNYGLIFMRMEETLLFCQKIRESSQVKDSRWIKCKRLFLNLNFLTILMVVGTKTKRRLKV